MYCTKLFESLDKRLNEKRSIDQIADELCENVKDGRSKVIRLIKQAHGDKYLIENAEFLKYNYMHTKKSSSKKSDDTPFQIFTKSVKMMNLKYIDVLIFRKDGRIEGLGEINGITMTMNAVSPITFKNDFQYGNVRGLYQFLTKFSAETTMKLDDNVLDFQSSRLHGRLKIELMDDIKYYVPDDFRIDIVNLKEKYNIDFYVVCEFFVNSVT